MFATGEVETMIGSELGAAPPGLPGRGDGFSWWYVDLASGPGEGLVLIWARGLPFVPPRHGRGDEVSVALAVYQGGREHFYALDAAPGDRLVDDGRGTVRIGRSSFTVRQDRGRTWVGADVDVAIAGAGRIRGTIEAEGNRAVVPPLGSGPLAWTPVAPFATGRAALSWDGGAVRMAGRAYVDGNAGDRPLEALGIEDWRWGRLSFPSRELIWFRIAPVDGAAPTLVVLESEEDGRCRVLSDASARFRDGLPGWFGLRRTTGLELLAGERPPVHVAFPHRVDDGPFYQRYLIEARSAGERALGVAERVAVPRLAATWHRPLVSMRIQRDAAPRSMWLPLFAGARTGRVGRLLSSMVGRRPEAA
jgi:hypothetical protein